MPDAFKLDDIVIIPDELTVCRSGQRVTLKPRSMSLLLVLVSEPGRVFSRGELLDRVWGAVEVSDQVLTNAVWELRQALGDSTKSPRFVCTIPRRGYKLRCKPQSLTEVATTNRRPMLRATALVSLLLLAGAMLAWWWAQLQPGTQPHLDVDPKLQAWQFKTGGEVHTDPVVIDNDLVIGSYDGFVYRLSLTGEERWRTDVSARIEQNLASDGERVYVVALDGYCYALDLKSGRELWRRKVESNSPPAATQSGVLIVGHDHVLWHLNAESGASEPIIRSVGVALVKPLMVDRTAILIEEDGRISAVDLQERRLRWRKQLDGAASSAPVESEGVIYVGTGRGYVYALDVKRGTELWRARVSARNASGIEASVQAGRVFASSGEGDLVAMDMASGDELWRIRGDGFFSPPRYAHGAVFAGNGDGLVYALDAADGRVLWLSEVGAWLLTRPAVVGGMVMIGDAAGYLNGLPLSGGHLSVRGRPTPEPPKPELLWSLNLGDPITIAPTHHQGILYVAAGAWLVAVDAESRKELWRYPALGAIHSQPGIGGGRVWFTTRAQQLIGIDLENELDVIEARLPANSISGPLWLGDGVAFGDQYGNVHRFDASGSRRWTVRVSEGSHPVNADPLLVDGMIVVGSCDGHIYALDAGSGEVVWRIRSGDCVVADTVAGLDLLYTGDYNGQFVAFDREGMERWRFSTDGEIWFQPAVAEGLVVFGNGDYHVYALDAESGEERWRYRAGNRTLSDVVHYPGLFIVGSYDGCLYALAAETGEAVWRFCSKRELINPMLVDDSVIVGGDDGVLYALRASVD